MAVGGAEAPGAGAANVVVADNTPPANAAPGNPSSPNATGQGSAASSGGPLPPVSTQPGGRTDAAQAAHLRADEAPLQTARIGSALIQLNEAKNKLVAAKRSGDESAKDAANREIQAAEHNLAKAIKQEAERLSCPSSFGAPAHHAGDLRKAEARIRGAFPSAAWGTDELVVGDAIRNIDRERLPLQVQRLSGAMRHGPLNSEQKKEADVIFAGVDDFVLTEPRADLAPSKVSQLQRLRGLVQSLRRSAASLPPLSFLQWWSCGARAPCTSPVMTLRH